MKSYSKQTVQLLFFTAQETVGMLELKLSAQEKDIKLFKVTIHVNERLHGTHNTGDPTSLPVNSIHPTAASVVPVPSVPKPLCTSTPTSASTTQPSATATGTPCMADSEVSGYPLKTDYHSHVFIVHNGSGMLLV